MSAKNKPSDIPTLFDLSTPGIKPENKKSVLEQNENLFRTILSSICDSVLILDWDGSILFANKAAFQLTGLDEHTGLSEINVLSFIHPDDISLAIRDLQLVREGTEGFLSEYRIRDIEGAVKWVEGLGRKINFKGREIDIVIIRDITERRKSQKKLLNSEEKFRTLAETTPAAIFMYQEDRLIYCNSATESLSGFSREELLNMPALSIIHPDMRQMVRQRMVGRTTGLAFPARYEMKIITKSGEEKWLELSAGVIEVDGKPTGMGTAHDITDRKKAEETITRLAYYDPLTGLPNRLLFNDRLNMAITRANRFQENVAVIMLDLDKFKDVNDTLGHSVGDKLLKAVAERMALKFRKSDTVARMGGDEFIICIPDLKEEGNPHQIAEKILDCFVDCFEFEGRELSIKPSIGIAIYPEDGPDVEMLVRNADIAMYKAKHAGGNQHRVYSEL